MSFTPETNEFDEIFASVFGDQSEEDKDVSVTAPQEETTEAAQSIPETADYEVAYKEPYEEPAAKEGTAQEAEEEFDPRFKIRGRQQYHQDFTYNGHIVNAGAEAGYSRSSSPEYEELQSSYSTLDDDYTPDSEDDAEPEEKKKIFSFFKGIRGKKKEEPAIDLPDLNMFETGLDEPVIPDQDAFPEEEDTLKADALDDDDFNAGGLSGADTDLPDSDEPGADSATFTEYLSSVIAGIAIKLNGGARASNAGQTAEEDEDDTGKEVPFVDAAKYYGNQLSFMQLRCTLSLVVLLFIMWLSAGMPVTGMLNAPKVCIAAILAGQTCIMVLALDVVTTAFIGIFRRHVGADTLALIACVITFIDGVMALNSSSIHMPLCAVSSASLTGVLYSSWFSSRGIRKAARVPAIAKRIFTVTAESNVGGSDPTILKSSRKPDGFVRRIEEAPIDEDIYSRFGIYMLIASAAFALITTAIKRVPSQFSFILSAYCSAVVPFTALLCYPIAYYFGSSRLFTNGAALAGWAGLCDIGRSRNMIVTDRDLFPPETVEISNVRIFADYDASKVITYAGSLLIKAECGLVPAFSRLMQENECEPCSIVNFAILPGGGMKGMAEGHSLICGNSDIMRLMNVKIPQRLVEGSSVLLAIDGILYGIFNIKYSADPKVRKALVSLMRSNRHPIFAIRDFNITPAMISKCFDVATDGYDFPPYADRFPLSQAKPAEDSKIAGVLCREGLGPLVAMADMGRGMFIAARVNTVLSLLCAAVSFVYVFFRFFIAGTVTAGNILIIMLIFTIPILLIGMFPNLFN